MAICWTGAEVICDCGSKDIENMEDENCGSCEDYAVYKCRDCGKIIRIELPN